jgi:hypothetical protein
MISIGFFFLISTLPYKSSVEVTPEEVLEHIRETRSRVHVFEFVKDEAKKLGVRAFLFGGTAASFGFYNVWDLRRIKGDKNYLPERFNYEYPEIYRSTQDADFAIDGTLQQAAHLEAILHQKANFLAGGKVRWEVATLRYPRGYKPALIDDFDFSEQHTDSASVGMIELTDPPADEPLVRDLRFFHTPIPPFLLGLAENKIYFYFGPRHEETQRYRLGLNPSIVSVMRYLIKLAQFEAEPDEVDRPQVQKIIDEFDPHSVSTGFKDWFRRNGAKPFLQSNSVEYAADLLDSFGARKKFIAVDDDWVSRWLSREPLRSRPVGEGKGRRAKDLNIDIISHETVDFKYFEAITASPRGIVNAFLSRPGRVGETANFGEGFYNQIGKYGARGTGLTVRTKLNPEAREGTDFFIAAGDYVRLMNPQAGTILQESHSMTPIQLLRALVAIEFDNSDLGSLLRFQRRIVTNDSGLEMGETIEADALIKTLIRRDHKESSVSLKNFLMDWDYPVLNYSKLIEKIPALRERYGKVKANYYIDEQNHAGIVEVAGKLLDYNYPPELIDKIIDKADAVALKAMAKEVFSKPNSYRMNEQIDRVFRHRHFDDAVLAAYVEQVFSKEFHSDKIPLLKSFLGHGFSPRTGIFLSQHFLNPNMPDITTRFEAAFTLLLSHSDETVKSALASNLFAKTKDPNILNKLPLLIERQGSYHQRLTYKAVEQNLVELGRVDLLKAFESSSDPLTRMASRKRILACQNRLATLAEQP